MDVLSLLSELPQANLNGFSMCEVEPTASLRVGPVVAVDSLTSDLAC